MAVVNELPNGYLVVTLSPREAVMLMDQILDPNDFAWQSSESQIVAMEVKASLKHTLEVSHHRTTEMLKAAIPARPKNPDEEPDPDDEQPF